MTSLISLAYGGDIFSGTGLHVIDSEAPHTQVVGTLSGCQPYLKARASQNADL